MSESYTLKVSPDQAQEMPMVDLAFEILKASNTPFYYRDLMKEIAKIKNLSDEEMMDVIAQVYTEINIDGRFACVGSNLWGLKRWYPVEKADDSGVGNNKRPRIINDEDDDDIDEDIFGEEDDAYDGDGEVEDFDSIDEDRDEFFAEEEEVEEEIVDEDAEDDVIDEDEELDDDGGEDAEEEEELLDDEEDDDR
ncbi:DNA-directed RNA polymerase subunit delta [Paenibacillus thermotolerans]|uniref:DNA-directed RNA polymerase subunit delta n=1 Tax=Paenibacillus thermotolerans TaxID=3027807 RepID=UPI002368D30B|nr:MULTISPECIES: DNA-directed RNA polymerase subunit delta [unclassified Paenibacillus]